MNKEELRSIPILRKEKSNLLEVLQKQISENKYVLSTHEAKIFRTVTDEKDEEGKDKFSSDVKRKIEVKERLKTNVVYLDIKEGIEKLEHESKTLEIDIKFLSDSLRVAEILSTRYYD